MTRKNYFIILLVLIATNIHAQIDLQLFSTGYTAPIDVKHCGDDRLFIVQQNGYVYICDTDGVKNPNPFLDIHLRVTYGGEQGLLGLAFAPDYATSGYFYVNYTRSSDGDTHISRFKVDSLDPDLADPNSEEVLIHIWDPFSNHNGGHVAFGPDGFLYTGMGDGGSGGDPGNRAQNPDSLLGKMLRIDVSTAPGYTIPLSNPFALDTTLGRPEIWALGLRNPWRWSFDYKTGDLWIGDVGQNAIEEIDMQPADSGSGWNYGWRCYEANTVYNTTSGCLPYSDYIPPVHQYNHAGGYCSVTGGYVYRGTKFQELYGKYFYADYCKSQMQYLVLNDTGGYSNTNLDTLGATSITSFGVDRKNEIYCSGSGGRIWKLISLNCAPVSAIEITVDSISNCASGMVGLSVVQSDTTYTYSWELNGTPVSNDPTYTATQAGVYVLHVDNNQGCLGADTVFLFVTPPTLSFTGLDSIMCVYNNPVNLFPNMLGGTFSGTGVSGATFNPTTAGLGIHTVTYTISDSMGCAYNTTKDIVVDACLNVPENSLTSRIHVYPNPSTGIFSINVYSGNERNVSMELTDLTGRVINSGTLNFSNGDNKIPVELNVAKGMYMMKFSDEVSSSSIRIIVQ